MRIILFTGKGGVGKTSVAAASACRCAELGYRTMIYSTDAAHSLSDAFDTPIGNTRVAIADNLYAEEIDVNEKIRKNWGPIKDFLQTFLKYRGFEDVIADELAVFPGMDEIFCMLELKEQYVEGRFEVIIIDCAPTGETMRLLAAPDIAKWYMEKIFSIERTVFKAVRPLAHHFVDMPLPGDDVFASMESLYKNLVGIKEVLTDREVSSIRIVLNPEKMVVKESQRAYTFLNLFGYMVDAVIVNRLLPPEVKDPYYGEWIAIQKKYVKEINNYFHPLPVFSSRLWEREVIGLPCLSTMAGELYGSEDPARIFYRGQPIEVKSSRGSYSLLVKLPFAQKKELDMWVKGDDLIIQYKNFKRIITLPRALASRAVKGVEFKNKTLQVTFGGDHHE
jgi:arsenite-transporting ATPase